MNNQEAFNNTWRFHVVEGNPLGYDEDQSGCVYINEDGLRCAIGCQLPDRLAEKAQRIGNPSVYSVIAEVQEIRDLFADSSTSFLTTLQNTHDSVAQAEEMSVVTDYSDPKGMWLENRATRAYDPKLTPRENLEACYRILAESFNLEIPGN